MKRVLYFFILLILGLFLRAQGRQTVRADTARGAKSFSAVVPVKDTAIGTGNKDTVKSAAGLSLPSFAFQEFGNRHQFVRYLLTHNRIFQGVDQPALRLMHPVNEHQEGINNRTVLFYLLLAVFFILAVIRLGFRKYFHDLFRAFFSPTLSQRQLKDQLYQTPFPAFALNLFFTFSAGLYLYLVLLYTDYLPMEDPLYLVALFVFLFMIIYLVKYILLRICGWLFGYGELMDNYIFTLFLVNKVLGVVLLPFILLLAFSTSVLSAFALNISLILIILSFVYRYIRLFPWLKSQIDFSKFHFFLYLCGFEVAPILIIGKLTLIWLNGA